MKKVSTLEKYRFESYEEIRDLENPENYNFAVECPRGNGEKPLTRLDFDELPMFTGIRDNEVSDYDTYFSEYDDAECAYHVLPIEEYELENIVAYKIIML